MIGAQFQQPFKPLKAIRWNRRSPTHPRSQAIERTIIVINISYATVSIASYQMTKGFPIN